MRKKQSLFHISRRDTLPLSKALLIRGGILLLALVFCGLITTILTGKNPIDVYATILSGAFGTSRRIGVTFRNVAVLLGLSLAVTPAFKMRFWNIGAEGQTMIGCLATTTCMILLGDKLSTPLLILVSLIASLLAGALWGFLPAFFKAKWNTNETLFTLMMNYIAMQLASYFIIVWEVPKGAGKIGIINQPTQAGWLPTVGNEYLLPILIVALMTGFMYIYLQYSKHGYEISVVGESERTARYVGIKVGRVIVRTMLLSGAIWGFLPAFFKAKWNTNETLFTLMMNYVAMQLASYFIIIWEVPKGAGKIGIINQDSHAGWLPTVGNEYLLPILIVALMTGFMFIYLQYSKHGYEIAVVGESQRTASYAGIKVDRVIIRTMILSGSLCAMMGFLMTSGIDHTLTTTIVDSRGFTAVMVSWMSKFNPFIMIAASLLLVTMDRGASEVSSTLGLNHSFADILTGIILFFIIATEFFITYKVTLRKSSKKEA